MKLTNADMRHIRDVMMSGEHYDEYADNHWSAAMKRKYSGICHKLEREIEGGWITADDVIRFTNRRASGSMTILIYLIIGKRNRQIKGWDFQREVCEATGYDGTGGGIEYNAVLYDYSAILNALTINRPDLVNYSNTFGSDVLNIW